jgi:hypothetical protein
MRCFLYFLEYFILRYFMGVFKFRTIHRCKNGKMIISVIMKAVIVVHNFSCSLSNHLHGLREYIATYLLKALQGNGSINTPRPTCTQQWKDVHL